MMSKIELSTAVKYAMIFCFLLFAVDALGYGWYIFGLAFCLMGLYLLISHKNLELNALFFWVALLAFSNFLIMFVHSNASLVTKIIKYLISPIGGYLIGLTLASTRKEKDSIIKLYFFAVIPYFIHGVLDLLIFDGFAGFEREIADFWTGELWKATLVCTYFAMTVPLFFLAFFTNKISKKIAYLFFTVASVYACIVTASRTVIFIGLIVTALIILLCIFGKKKAERKNSRGIIIFQFLIIGAIVAVILSANIDALASTDFFNRMFESDMSEEPRIQLFKNIIDNAWMYPFGNMPYFYSHNTWLDFLRESGWITFAFFCVITVIVIRDIIRIYRDKELSQEHRIAVVAMMTALMLDMFVEPVMDGAAILFSLFFYFIGVNSRFAQEAKRRKKDV